MFTSGMISNAGIDPVLTLYEKNPNQAASVWLGIETVANGLSGANGEFLGGLFTLLVSWVALRTKRFPKILNYLGLLVGTVGIISIIPGLKDLTGFFGISQIAWFIWLGLILLRSKSGNEITH